MRIAARFVYCIQYAMRSTPLSEPASAISLWSNRAGLAFEPVRLGSLHHQVQVHILKATYEGSLNPGDRLNEGAIAAQIGVSRTPVREALTYLESTGLVIRRQRRGFFLAAVSATDAEHCYAVRELLEGYAAKQIAGHLADTQVERLQAIVDAMGRAVEAGNWPQTAVHNIAFHEAVVGMVGNPVLLRMWTSVGPILWLFDSLTRRGVDPRAKESFVRRHKVLLATLRRDDPSAAEAAFIAHIADVKRVVVHRLQTGKANQRGEGR